eukprot:CAMPEP_0202427454 /NCGR_PEP_ID=MMETSP1345-20130828/1681_1 /ASSEMBLY_ACC=CAM_ASM_000843 /TAXON_ID=342563 /ORGANISM="Fabrea Fabrea salina" /LENGTH=38 /DNA_ID= /DNA_START= /DNA_END= /DNA_ORIENTATION=
MSSMCPTLPPPLMNLCSTKRVPDPASLWVVVSSNTTMK